MEISADAMDTSPHIYLLMGISCNASCEICDLSPETEAKHTQGEPKRGTKVQPDMI